MSNRVSRLVMVRHAHADWLPDERRPLSPTGTRDAVAVARRLAPLPLDAIYSSPYPRALGTVEPLAAVAGLEIHVVDDLRERTLAEGAVDDFPAAMRASWRDPDLAFPGGETSRAACRRFAAAIDEIATRHAGGTVVVATHGNVLGLWLRHLDPAYDHAFWSALTWPDIYRVELERGRLLTVERLWNEVVE
jgi:2,3-bisphosphoglycerate-dependent phosphoglycerate mutase